MQIGLSLRRHCHLIVGTFCPVTESELIERYSGARRLDHLDELESSDEPRDCTVCPSGSTKEEIEAACYDMFDDFADDHHIDISMKDCMHFCDPLEIAERKVETITVLANRQSGGEIPFVRMYSFAKQTEPFLLRPPDKMGQDMMLLGYNMDTKKVTHNNDGPFISIEQMDGDFGVDDYWLVEDSRFTSPYTANPNWQGGEEVHFSDNMIMYCCFNEQFQGDFA